jgi:hypothetical protein
VAKILEIPTALGPFRAEKIFVNRTGLRSRARHPGVSYDDLKPVLIAERLATMRAHDPCSDKWLGHPLPTMAEPDLVHAARLFGKVSLHAIDRFFMQIRRAVSVQD